MVLGNRYEIRAVLGRGGMGEVFYAYDRRLANEVALKRLNPQLAQSPEMRESLTREARIMARLSDAAIVRLFDLEEFEDNLYLVLEYVCGPTLREMLKSGYRASPVELMHAMSQICQGLTVAHAAGVIHRDLKPSNLLLSLQGAERAAFAAERRLPARLSANLKITDFGIAKAIADSRATLTNAFSGTPGYMAPEQFRGETPSPATDVYALGVLTHELLTGRLPERPLQPIGGVHPAVTQVVAQATMAARESRFATASAFYTALYSAMEGRAPERPVLRPARNPRPALAVALAAILALLAVLVAISSMTSHVNPYRVDHVTPMPVFRTEEKPDAITWRPLLRTTILPAVVDAARGVLPTGGLAGPARPKIKWGVSLDDSMLRMGPVGTDGTVYASSMTGVCALREGKLQWAFKTGTLLPVDARFDADGRLWLETFDTVYCLNRDGQGGRLPSGFHAPAKPASSGYLCIDHHQLWGPRMLRMDLDGNCNTDTVAARPGGGVYVGTDVPQILAVSADGAVKWKFTPPCEPKKLVTAGADRLVYTCADNSLHGMTGAAGTWSHTADGALSQPVEVDAAGSVYYGDHAKEVDEYHLHVLDAQGNVTGTVDMAGYAVNGIAIGGQKRMYVAGSGRFVRIVCLGE